MLTDKQKKSFKRITVFTLILGFIMLIPFRTISTSSVWYYVEIGVKFGFIPVVMILFSINANIVKYRQLKENRFRSKVINIMSYFPICVYLMSVLTFTMHTMTLSDAEHSAYSPIGISLWGVLFVVLLAYLLLLIVQMVLINKVVMNFNQKKHMIFDICYIVMTICLMVIAWSVTGSYRTSLVNTDVFAKGDVLVLGIFVLGFGLAFFIGGKTKDLIDEDEMLVNVNIAELSDSEVSLLTLQSEYNRAYDYVMADFEEYFKTKRVPCEELPKTPEEVFQYFSRSRVEDVPADVATETPAPEEVNTENDVEPKVEVEVENPVVDQVVEENASVDEDTEKKTEPKIEE